MKFRHIVYLSAIFFSLLLVPYLQHGLSNEDTGIPLVPPAFLGANSVEAAAQDAGFLYHEAGIAAYTQLPVNINLDTVELYVKSISARTDEYLIGSMPPREEYDADPTLEGKMDVHLFVRQDGWIVAYQLAWQEPALIVDWIGNFGEGPSTTTLETAIRTIANNVGASITSKIAYYDFEHPTATGLLLAADREAGHRLQDSFEMRVASGLELYEMTWMHAMYSTNDQDKSEFYVNDVLYNLLQTDTDDDIWLIASGEWDDLRPLSDRVNNYSVYNYRFYESNNSLSISYISMSATYGEAGD